MLTEARISAVKGSRYRVEVDGSVTGYLPALATACHWSIDFEAQVVRRESLRAGDRVLAYVDDGDYSQGVVLGLCEEGV